jgi:hypothetical protein
VEEPTRGEGTYDWPFDESQSKEEGLPEAEPPENSGWGNVVTEPEVDTIDSSGWGQPPDREPTGEAPPPVTPGGADPFGTFSGDSGFEAAGEQRPAPPSPPVPGPHKDEEPQSFFFEEDIQKKGKKRDSDSFWE